MDEGSPPRHHGGGGCAGGHAIWMSHMSAAVGHPPGGRACGNATLMEMSVGTKKRRDHKVPDAMPRQAHQELLACKPTPHYNCPHQAQMRSRCALVRRPLTAAQRRHRPAPCMSRRSFPQALAPFCNRTIASNSTPPCPASERLSGLGAQSSGKPVAGPAPGARCQVEEYSMAGGRGGRWWALPATCPF